MLDSPGQHGNPIFLDKEHASFEMTMEVLCSLSKFPKFVILANVRMDLGIKDQPDVMRCIRSIRSRGICVSTENTRFGREATIEEKSWAKAKKLGNEYWNRVYGSQC